VFKKLIAIQKIHAVQNFNTVHKIAEWCRNKN